MYENVAKRLRWLAFNFPHTDEPKSESDKICNCINLYCTEAADAIEELNKRIDFLMNCICEAEDSLDRGTDNDWARAALEKAERLPMPPKEETE